MHHADDLHAGVGGANRRLRQPRHPDDPADGIGAVEARALERLVDERDLPAARDVGGGEHAPFQERDPERSSCSPR